MRGSTICCSLLISSGCNYLFHSNEGNTPLSSAIYFKRETCVLSLLRSIEQASNRSEVESTLNEFHYLPSVTINETLDEDDLNGDNNLRWLGNEKTDDLYPTKRIQLYKLILSYKWEGISWLVLGNLVKYNLSRFDSIQSAVMAGEFSLALRLIEKIKREMSKTPLDAYECLFKQSKSEMNRSLLHFIALMDFR